MSTLNYVALILALASCLYNDVINARPIDNIKAAAETVQLSIQSGVPQGQSPVHLLCNELAPTRSLEFDIPPLISKNLTVPVFAVYKCDATWTNKKGSFVAYDKSRDTTQTTIYWIIDPLGFSESYDRREWKKIGSW